jgi:hypothetical protein
MSIKRPTVFRKLDIMEGLSKATKEAFGSLKDGTKGREKFIEPKPRLIKCDAEKVYQGSSNSFILMGQDRPGSCGSGKGGRGDTHSSAFRVTVGHMGARAAAVNKEGESIAGHPSNTYDAATLYVTQKADIDTDFQLVQGKMPLSKNRSAIVLKADGIRIVAREGIKIITGVDERNSQDSNITSGAYGIDLIANNDDSDMQPLVKGHSLTKALAGLLSHVDNLAGIVDAFVTSQMILNTFLQGHHHVSFVAGPTSPDPALLQVGCPAINADLALRVKTGCFFHKINSSMFTLNYLNPISRNWICSLNNNTN